MVRAITEIIKTFVIWLMLVVTVDMTIYYFNAFTGHSVPPYPVIKEILDMIKEIHTGVTHA